MEKHHEFHTEQQALNLTLSAAALATIVCTIELLRIPADSKNAFLFGLSKERLLMLMVFTIIFIINLFCLLQREKLAKHPADSKKGKVFCMILTIIPLFFLLMPDYRFKRAAAYFTRLRPFILWIFLTSFSFFLFFSYAQDKFSGVIETLSNLFAEKRAVLVVLAVLCCGILFVEITGLGKTVESTLWNKNGIPLQSIQLFSSLVVFCLIWKTGLFNRIGQNKRLLNFLLIWAVSALIWSLAPMADHFFAPGPYQPNGAFYPYSDALNYDFAAQTALLGWRYNMKRTLLKPTLVFISFLSHLVTGNDNNLSMMVQSALYAILPAIIYLFGTAIGGNGCGYLAAAFSLIKEWNALQTRTVLTIHSRLFMSEFLTQILLAVYCYALFRWLKKDKKESLYAIIAGGTVVLGFFTRYNFAAFLPAGLLLVLIAYRKNFLRLLKTLILFCLTAALTAAPLLYRDKDIPWGLYDELNFTVESILFKNRLSNPTPTIPVEVIPSESIPAETKPESEIPTDVLPSPEPVTEPIKITETEIQTDTVQSAEPETVPEMVPETDENLEDAAAPLPDENTEIPVEAAEVTDHQEAPVQEIPADLQETAKEEFNTGQITQGNSNEISTVTLPVYQSIINHGLHNFIASALTLPMELSFDNLEHLYTQEGDGLWRDSFRGEYSAGQWAFILVWIILGAAAIGILIRNHGIAGFSIPYFWLVYSFSIGISRSSGGRYVVPTNWIPMMLLAYCITLLFSKGKIRLPESVPASLPLWQPAAAMFGFFAFFSAMYLLEIHMPQKQTAAPQGDLAILQERLSDHEEINWDLVRAQQEQGVLHVTHGAALYPRFYYFRDGENVKNDLLMWKEYSRMIFTGADFMGGWNSLSQGYMMPHTEQINDFPHESVFRAISCKSEFNYEDVLAVTVETKDGEVYTYVRDPLPAFSCPVPEPVCYSLENCR